MRKARRNDNYVASRLDYILNSIPTNPYIGFNNTIQPFNSKLFYDFQNETSENASQEQD